MTTVKNTSTNLYYLIVFRLLFQILKPIRLKYKLSINAILILNSCYLYTKLVKDQFYKTDILKFTKYFNSIKINVYIDVLTLGGFISPVNPDQPKIKYILTSLGYECINEIDQYYNSELYEFSNKYNLDL
jgi:hypothetical protein